MIDFDPYADDFLESLKPQENPNMSVGNLADINQMAIFGQEKISPKKTPSYISEQKKALDNVNSPYFGEQEEAQNVVDSVQNEPDIIPAQSTPQLFDVGTPMQESPVISENIEESPLSATAINPELSKWFQMKQALSSLPRQNTDDEQLQQLREQRDKKQALMTMLAGLNQGIGTAMSAYGAKVGSGLEPIEAAMKQAEQPVQDYTTDQKTKSDRLQKLMELQAKLRPKEVTDLDKARLELLKTQKEQLEKGGGMTPFQQAILNRQNTAEERREEAGERKYRQDQINTARGLLKDDPRFKPAMTQLMEFENVNTLLDQSASGNQAAVAALGTKLARAMGEVGVLTDTDVVRYVQGRSWGRKLKTWFEGGMEGEIPKEALKDMTKEVSAIKKNLDTNVNRIYKNSFNRMKTAYPDLEENTITGLLGSSQQSQTKTLVKKQYSKSANKTKLIYSDGSEEIVDGQQ
jgi:hypothetical protein